MVVNRRRPEPMSRVDTAWLRMDNAVNLMMINGVWLLTPTIGIRALRECVAARLLRYPRFHQIARVDALGAQWIEDEDFDIARHVVIEKLTRRQGHSERQALQQRCGELAATPLDRSRPLWMFHFIERYEGGSAMIARIHHCIGDGMALISVMLSLTDGGSEPPQRDPAADLAAGRADWLMRKLADGAARAMAMSVDGMTRLGVQTARDLAAFALMDDDSHTLLKGKPAGEKVVAWGEPMALDVVKAIGKALNCSINDVLMACAAGAIGAYLRARGDEPAGKEIRAMVPVNLRPLEDAWKLGNRFGLAPLVLPIGIDNPVARVFAVRQRMDRLKCSTQPRLAFGVLALAGLCPKSVQDLLLGVFAKKATAVMTNVPGPSAPVTFCGSTLRQAMFWVPSSGDIGVGVSILSYAGGVQFGLITDRALCADPQAVIDRFEPEFERLEMLALMLPWAGEG